jgi:hypothetical protein
MTKKEAFQELANTIKKDGKIFIGFVHEFYGPLRSLNFIVNEPSPEYVSEYLDSQKKWESISTEIWLKTKLAVRPMAFPLEMLSECETPPKTFNTFKMAEAHLKELIKKNPGLDQDPYFYRLGKI